MKSKMMLGLALFIVCFTMMQAAFSQGLEPNVPPEQLPKTLEKNVAPAKLPEKSAPESAPTSKEVIIPKLVGLIIVKSMNEVIVAGVPRMGGVLKIKDIPLLSGEDFEKVVFPYFDQPVTYDSIKDLERDIILFYRKTNRPLVDVVLPEQNLDSGILQLVVIEGKVGRLAVNNEGKKWFSDELILKQVRLHPGDPVDSRQLLADMDWLNRNPFRQVDVLFKTGQKPGQSDVELKVEDRFPLRLYTGYENSGTKLTGEDRVLGGFNWGNVFGLDQQFNYQYTTDINFDLLQAHSASYQIPMPWRHTLTFYGSYVDAKADLPAPTNQRGRSWQTSLRYMIPLPALDSYQHATTLGFDFKHSNNNLEFGGTTVSASTSEIAQFEGGYGGALPDALGQTSFGGELYYSPGDLTGKNDTTDFQPLRDRSVAHYCYGKLSLERMTRLPYGFSWIVTGSAQLSTERLLPSEELGLGGYATVRGYTEREANGDSGWVISNELRTPPLSVAQFLRMKRAYDQLQFLCFSDFGIAYIKDAEAALGENPNTELWSVGVGLRYTINPYLSVRFDYGWQLKDTGTGNPDSSRAHAAVLVSF